VVGRRALHYGKFDTGGIPTEGSSYVTWIRWRLIDELLRRYYVDIGLEPAFGLMGTELYQVPLTSPTCRRAPRYFGRLCGIGIHPEDDTDTCSIPGVELAWSGTGGRDLHEGAWTTWSEYLHDAIHTLGLAGAGVTWEAPILPGTTFHGFPLAVAACGTANTTIASNPPNARSRRARIESLSLIVVTAS